MRFPIWNIVFILFFLISAFIAIDLLAQHRRIFLIGPWEFGILALATFRLTRLFTYDHITDFVRGWFKGASENSFRGTVYGLLSCPWCCGLWFGFIAVVAFFWSPYAYAFLLVLAVAGAGSLVQLFANLLGWSAEGRKRAVLAEQVTRVEG